MSPAVTVRGVACWITWPRRKSSKKLPELVLLMRMRPSGSGECPAPEPSTICFAPLADFGRRAMELGAHERFLSPALTGERQIEGEAIEGEATETEQAASPSPA